MRALLVILTAATLAACTTHTVKEPDKTAWQAFGYKGMAAKINRLAGSNSFNCGIYNKLEPNDPVNKQMSVADSRACIKQSLNSKIPFRYGSIRIPTDSYLFDALILSSTGEFWTVRYDTMLDGSGSAHFIERCNSVKVDYSDLTYEGVDCKPVSTEEWLSDIAEQTPQQ